MELSRSEYRKLQQTLGLGANSDYWRINIGAAIFSGKRLVFAGHNRTKSHPTQAYYNKRAGRITKCDSLHAEMSVLIPYMMIPKCDDAELYVTRMDRNGLPAMCKPCPACELAIREAGIKRVFYTTPTGVEVLNVG